MAPEMTGDFVKGRDCVTDPAKLDVIAASQAKDNEQHRSVVSRSFVCKCVYSKLLSANIHLSIADTLTGMLHLTFSQVI